MMCGRSCSASATPCAARRRLTASRERRGGAWHRLGGAQPYLLGLSLSRHSRLLLCGGPVASQLQCKAPGPPAPPPPTGARPAPPPHSVLRRQLVGDAEFESPDAGETTVLVTGATGRVGRVLVRKLLLRGYKVKALVRQREAGAAGAADAAAGPSQDGGEGQEAIPQAAELVYGDVADYKACRRAVQGVNKVGTGGGGRCRRGGTLAAHAGRGGATPCCLCIVGGGGARRRPRLHVPLRRGLLPAADPPQQPPAALVPAPPSRCPRRRRPLACRSSAAAARAAPSLPTWLAWTMRASPTWPRPSWTSWWVLGGGGSWREEACHITEPCCKTTGGALSWRGAAPAGLGRVAGARAGLAGPA